MRWRSILVRLWRIGLLIAAVLLIRGAVEQRAAKEAAAALTPQRVRDFFPEAAALGEMNPANAWRPVLDDRGQTLGFAATTAPASDKIIGYSGPTNSLIAFDSRGSVIGTRILKSHDTPDHVAEVIADRKFFTQFREMKPGAPAPLPLHTVSGATLTSAAIAQGVLEKLGQSSKVSLRFPEDITLAEVRVLEPAAVALQPSQIVTDGKDVLDAKGARIGIAAHTSPLTDALVGYKGPTDTLMLLDPTGKTLRRMALRKSYDTKRYVAYVTGDDYFLNLFNGLMLEKLAAMDFAKAKVEGVSGATETSWSVAEGLKRRSQSLLEQRPAGWVQHLRWRWQDTGHVIVIAVAFLMAFTHLRGINWVRHLHHAALVIYAGFVASELLSQSLFGGWAAHGTPWRNAPGLLLLGVVALLAPVFTSRQIYCHHICPHGALQQLLARRVRWQWRVPPRLDRWLAVLPFGLLALVLLTMTQGWDVNLNAIEPFDAYLVRFVDWGRFWGPIGGHLNWIAGWGTLSVAAIGLIASLFTPLAYCKYGCPTGALFKLLRFTGDNDRLGVRDWLAVTVLALAWLV
ncbi:MAG: FMN-binding protein [Prosthecobacter sp.]|nr:FMN-binding protein [Prosthecobacter sp.]